MNNDSDNGFIFAVLFIIAVIYRMLAAAEKKFRKWVDREGHIE